MITMMSPVWRLKSAGSSLHNHKNTQTQKKHKVNPPKRESEGGSFGGIGGRRTYCKRSLSAVTRRGRLGCSTCAVGLETAARGEAGWSSGEPLPQDCSAWSL